MPYGYYGFDTYSLLLLIPAMLIAVFAQVKVKSAFSKYSAIRTLNGLTGAQAAERVLSANGVSGVRIEQVSGELTDHFDPKANVIRLSDSVYGAATIAAVGVAAHEAGHAVQYAKNYAPIKLRNAIIPATRFGSSISGVLLILGIVFGFQPLVLAGIVLFSLSTLFQLLTLPVELDASSRALSTIHAYGLLHEGEEEQGAKKVLTAAAMTYVAALLVSLAQLLRLILIFGRGRRR